MRSLLRRGFSRRFRADSWRSESEAGGHGRVWQNAGTKKLKARSTVHLTFDQLEAVYLAFNLSIVPCSETAAARLRKKPRKLSPTRPTKAHIAIGRKKVTSIFRQLRGPAKTTTTTQSLERANLSFSPPSCQIRQCVGTVSSPRPPAAGGNL